MNRHARRLARLEAASPSVEAPVIAIYQIKDIDGSTHQGPARVPGIGLIEPMVDETREAFARRATSMAKRFKTSNTIDGS